MTGLDKIIEKINCQAQAEADEVIGEAEKQAAEIISEAESKADAECAAIVSKTREKAQLMDHIAVSGAELAARNMRLQTRRTVIAEVLEDAENKLNSLPDEQYFDVIIKLCKAYAQSGRGELVLSQKDKARMPSDFMSRLNADIADKGAELVAADDCARIKGGFVLRYGGIEENCSFSALIEQQKESLSDKLSALLFA